MKRPYIAFNLNPYKIKIRYHARKINNSEENDAKKISIVAFSITTFSFMILGITTPSITTLSIMALSIMQRILVLSVGNAQCHLC